MKHDYRFIVGAYGEHKMCALCGKMDCDEGPDQWQCPGTGALLIKGVPAGEVVTYKEYLGYRDEGYQKMKHKYDWFNDKCVLCGKNASEITSSGDVEECPGTGAHMKMGHFGGIKPGDIVRSADIYESYRVEPSADAPLPAMMSDDGGRHVYTLPLDSPLLDKDYQIKMLKNLVKEQAESRESLLEQLQNSSPPPSSCEHPHYTKRFVCDSCGEYMPDKHNLTDPLRAENNVLHTEIARLKARVRELEPEQPHPRPLYRWGRPV